MSKLLINTDNVKKWLGLKDAESGDYGDDTITVKMSLFEDPALPVNNAAAATRELQTLLPDVPATAGTWTLTYEGKDETKTTAAIDWDATTGDVQDALELLSNITAGDVTVEGAPLDMDPVAGGMTFLWKDTLGDVNLLSFDFTSLTGPTQAASTMTETVKGVLKGVAVDEGGGKVGIPVIGHGRVAGDYVRIECSRKYNAEYTIDSVTNDKIVITATYVAETFKGTERVYLGVPNGTNIALPYVTASDGNYRGVLPYTLEGLIEYGTSLVASDEVKGKYFLFMWAAKDTSKATKRIAMRAEYDE